MIINNILFKMNYNIKISVIHFCKYVNKLIFFIVHVDMLLN